VPLPRAGEWVASYKLSKRFDQDISAVCVGLAVQVRDGRVHTARIAFGGMAAIPARAHAAESALIGADWKAAGIEQAAAALDKDFQPLTDLRATSGYRLRAARNLLRRFYLEHGGASAPVRTAAVVAASV